MPQIKEASVGSQLNKNSTLQYPFGLCSDVLFIGTIFSRNWHLLFNLPFVFLLLHYWLQIYIHPDISKFLFCSMNETEFSHKYVRQNIERILKKV